MMKYIFLSTLVEYKRILFGQYIYTRCINNIILRLYACYSKRSASPNLNCLLQILFLGFDFFILQKFTQPLGKMGNKHSGSDDGDDDDDDDKEIDFLGDTPYNTVGFNKNTSTVLKEKLLDILLNNSNDIDALSLFLHENLNFDLNVECKSFLCYIYISVD